MIDRTINDTRRIIGICTDHCYWRVKKTETNCNFISRDIEEILPYEENGECAPHLWFAIYKEKRLIERINSTFVHSIEYEE